MRTYVPETETSQEEKLLAQLTIPVLNETLPMKGNEEDLMLFIREDRATLNRIIGVQNSLIKLLLQEKR